MKFIVTGAGGFIGHHLVSHLKKSGAEVIGIDIKHPEFEQSKADRFEIQDLREPITTWKHLFEGVDDVWALAADMGGMGFISQNHAQIMTSNVMINIHTLEAAKLAKVKRYLYTSSACVYPTHLQSKTNVKPLAEDMAYPADPQDGYGWEKIYTEKMCQYYHAEYALDTRIVRFHNIYGPAGTWRGGREKAPAALCRKVAEAIETGTDAIEIWGDGEQTRTFCYIDDCVTGLQKIMDSGYNEPLNLGRDEMVSINELADVVAEVAGVKLKKVHVDGPQGVRGRNSDNALFQRLMGWSPAIDLKTGIAQTYPWIQQQVRMGSKSPT
ncbi:MAG: NAD-dependent epimerase/dehydratase family protein [Candidatus Omnitrophota bacterium]|nr:NAD-dependent epimerase/dehydratase family protein [Candidatus Omnitrophota bacterium]